jgi:hypothetical protein
MRYNVSMLQLEADKERGDLTGFRLARRVEVREQPVISPAILTQARVHLNLKFA